MNKREFQSLISELANEFAVPGVAAGLWFNGRATYACHGVTSMENPLPIHEHTLFQVGSIGKNFTATALVLLAAEGAWNLKRRCAAMCRICRAPGTGTPRFGTAHLQAGA